MLIDSGKKIRRQFSIVNGNGCPKSIAIYAKSKTWRSIIHSFPLYISKATDSRGMRIEMHSTNPSSAASASPKNCNHWSDPDSALFLEMATSLAHYHRPEFLTIAVAVVAIGVGTAYYFYITKKSKAKGSYSFSLVIPYTQAFSCFDWLRCRASTIGIWGWGESWIW